MIFENFVYMLEFVNIMGDLVNLCLIDFFVYGVNFNFCIFLILLDSYIFQIKIV